MGRTPRDITGKRFGRLVAVRLESVPESGARWQCACDCGAGVVVPLRYLRERGVRSCGCLRRDTARETIKRTQAIGMARRLAKAEPEHPKSETAAQMLSRLW
jgi:hypothetical protein